MTPEELAKRHPYLFHVTLSGTSESIGKYGLLPTSKLLDLFEIKGAEREKIERKRRQKAVVIEHSMHGKAVINDQKPMSETALLKCLNDNLTPSDWLTLLNNRVFFWPNERRLKKFQNRIDNQGVNLEVIKLDTLALAKKYAENIELSPINSGNTCRKPTRRGLSTFTPLLDMSYADWSKKRGLIKCDNIAEVTIIDGVLDIGAYIVDVRQVVAQAT